MDYKHLEAIKESIGASGNSQLEGRIKLLVNGFLDDMKSSGVAPQIAESEKAIVVIAREVDYFLRTDGDVKHTSYWNSRITQLAIDGEETHTPEHESCVEPIKEEEIIKIIEEVL